MAEEQIEFGDQDQLRSVFGDHDRHLNLIRDELGVDVVLRNGAVHIIGDQAAVRQTRETLQQLAETYRRTGRLDDDDLRHALGTDPVERASNYRRSDAVDDRRAAESLGGDSLMESVANENDEHAIDLYERGRRIRPKSAGQERYLRAMETNDLVLCAGPAGSGKTYLAVAAAIHALRSREVRKIVLVRPAVEAGEKLGFLPGDMLAKVNPYLRPLLDALNDMLDFEQVQRYMSKDMIEILPLAFMRGRTLNETFIILDEGQNTTVTQMKMFLTRMGTGSRIVVTGDVTQLDLPENVESGLIDALDRLAPIEGVETVRLERADIVRHRLVREIVDAYADESDAAKDGQRF